MAMCKSAAVDSDRIIAVGYRKSSQFHQPVFVFVFA